MIDLATVTEILADDNPDAGHGRFKIGKPGKRQGQCVNDSQCIPQYRNLRKLLQCSAVCSIDIHLSAYYADDGV